MSDRNEFTLPRPRLTAIDDYSMARLHMITDHVDALEHEGRNLLSLLGIGDRSGPPGPKLPEFAELERWSNFSGALFAEYHTRAKRQMVEAARLYSDQVHVLAQVAALDQLLAQLPGDLRWTKGTVSRWIKSLTPVYLEHTTLTDGALQYLTRHIKDVQDMRTKLVEHIRAVAQSIDWVETVTQNRTHLTPDQARIEHENNLSAIRQLGTDRSSGRERVAAGAVGVAKRALMGGESVAVGTIDRDPGAVRKWLAGNIGELEGSGAKFLLLELPKADQEALNDFLASRGSATDQATLFEQLQRNGTPSLGWSADSALIELIQAAHRSNLPVVAGGPMVHTEQMLDRRATVQPYLAAMHNSSVHTYGGPGIILTHQWNTNVIDGLERLIPGLVSMDQADAADLLPGQTIITPWSGAYTPYSDIYPELRSDEARYRQIIDSNESSTIVFNPQPR